MVLNSSNKFWNLTPVQDPGFEKCWQLLEYGVCRTGQVCLVYFIHVVPQSVCTITSLGLVAAEYALEGLVHVCTLHAAPCLWCYAPVAPTTAGAGNWTRQTCVKVADLPGR